MCNRYVRVGKKMKNVLDTCFPYVIIQVVMEKMISTRTARMTRDGSRLVTVQRRRVQDEVFDQLLDQIKGGVWPVGEKLPSENELRMQLGVSRISVRESIKKLVALGIVETRQGEGSFVRKVSSNSYTDMMMPMFLLEKRTLLEILEYRKVMEVGATEIAVERATQEDIDILEEIVVRMEGDDLDMKEFAKVDLEFHMAISRSTKNDLIINSNNFVRDILMRSMESIVTNLGKTGGRYYHRKILEAIKRRDVTEATQMMREHVVLTIEQMRPIIMGS